MAIPTHLQPHTLSHHTATETVNAYGDPDRVWAEEATFTGWVQQDQRATSNDGARDQPGEQHWLLVTNYTALANRDRVVWAGHPSGSVTFEVWGPPEPAYRRAGELHHIEVTLRVWEG